MEKTDIIRKRAAVIAKAWTDSAYRRALVATPKEVVAREFALDLPADLTVTILEDSADTVHLVLVDPADLPDEEKAGPKAAILGKAWTDPAFKKALLADPKAAIAKEFKVTVPAGLTVKVVAQTADHAFGVIPVRPESLSDADLDKVAGGRMSQTEMENIQMGSAIVIFGGAAILQPETAPVDIATLGAIMYSDRGTVKKDAKVIGHAAKKVFHGW